ncbi:hypothetical protein SR39_23395 [Methylobacterium radiotolerans]|jgi:hypothetical protein|nr:hypothetical protein SR39_23395 [Methylobacterium radiotolerans]
MASTRGLVWAVGIGGNEKVCDSDVRLKEQDGRVRKLVPSQEPREAEAVLAASTRRRATWR